MKGEGNSLNYEFRMHDPRVGRFLSRDPLAKQFPQNSPYVFSENKVLQFIELEGGEIDNGKNNSNNSTISGNEIVKKLDEVIVVGGKNKSKSSFWKNASAFGKNFVLSAVVAGGVAFVVAAIASPVLTVVAVAYGAYQLGKTINEFRTGVDSETGQTLTEEDYYAKAGGLLGGIVGGGIGAKSGMSYRASRISQNGSPNLNETTDFFAKQGPKQSVFKSAEVVENLAAERNIKSLQEGLRNENTVQEILTKMESPEGWNASEYKIGGYKFEGKYFINEGNHRMGAALEYQARTGNSKYVDQLLNEGNWTPKAPPANQVRDYSVKNVFE